MIHDWLQLQYADRPSFHRRMDSRSSIEPGACHEVLDSTMDWWLPELKKTLSNASQDDPRLAKHICRRWLLPPFPERERQLIDPELEDYSQRGQSKIVDELLGQRTGGFYVESGALDGEQLSNSLFFEKSRQWRGVLIEANPLSFRYLLDKRRHAYAVNVCLSPTKRPVVMPFETANALGGLVDYMPDIHRRRIEHEQPNASATIDLQCFPIYSILMALDVSHVDFFSLDIEGAEVEVLYTIPFDRITVDVFSIEYMVNNDDNLSRKKLSQIKKLLVNQHGYRIVQITGEDVILQKP
ncbi:hypothetical protein LSH36_107g05100 [Paralvinella palmiformis]|uniref:Methyltransferase FkbM domain-containing protein n=1 Tax=Paralvinella palmiformis TaxID=53620 RepID=A0AAD9NBC9_9ANNE|nr:hypothetical protein LSH36_107g05100 [Paralvinella palmiformis]